MSINKYKIKRIQKKSQESKKKATYSPLKVVACNRLATCSETQLTWALPDQGEKKFHQKRHPTMTFLLFLQAFTNIPSMQTEHSKSQLGSRFKQGFTGEAATHRPATRNTRRGAGGKPVGAIPPMRSSSVSCT